MILLHLAHAAIAILVMAGGLFTGNQGVAIAGVVLALLGLVFLIEYQSRPRPRRSDGPLHYSPKTYKPPPGYRVTTGDYRYRKERRR